MPPQVGPPAANYSRSYVGAAISYRVLGEHLKVARVGAAAAAVAAYSLLFCF